MQIFKCSCFLLGHDPDTRHAKRLKLSSPIGHVAQFSALSPSDPQPVFTAKLQNLTTPPRHVFSKRFFISVLVQMSTSTSSAPRRERRRPQISCTECRRRKQKVGISLLNYARLGQLNGTDWVIAVQQAKRRTMYQLLEEVPSCRVLCT